MSADLAQYVTTKEAAKMLGVDPAQVVHILHQHRITGQKVGRDWLVFVPSLDEYRRTKSKRGWLPGKPRTRQHL